MSAVGIDRRHVAIDFDQQDFAALNAVDFSFDLVELLEIGEGAGGL